MGAGTGMQMRTGDGMGTGMGTVLKEKAEHGMAWHGVAVGRHGVGRLLRVWAGWDRWLGRSGTLWDWVGSHEMIWCWGGASRVGTKRG